MQFIILRKTYDSFGFCPTLHECGRRMARSFGEVAFGLATMEVVAWCETAVSTRPGLEGLRARFRQEIPRTPIARFEPTRQRIRLAYESNVALALVGDRHQLAPEALGEFFREFVSILASLRSTLMRKPGLDYEGFLEAVRMTEVSVCTLGTEESGLPPKTETRVITAGPWWERFGIDWSQYHPQAREILDDPFYWDPANDDSPHAAVAGAGFLADLRRWRAKHPADSPWDFLVKQFRQVGCLGRFNEFRATDPSDYVPRDSHIAEWHDRDVIALAFALLKVEGICDRKVGTAALQALARRCDIDVAARLGWNLTPKSIAIASRLQNDLNKRL